MRTGAILDVAVTCGGGAAAGYLDSRHADKKVGPLKPGELAALAGIGIGLTGIGGKYGAKALQFGIGAAAFEVGLRVAAMPATAGVRGVRGIAGVRGVQGLPAPRRPLTSEEWTAMTENLRAANRAA